MAKTTNRTTSERESTPTGGGALSTSRPRNLGASQTAYPVNRLRSEFDRLFENFFPGWQTLWGRGEELEQRWGMDVEDRDDKIIVHAEAPGFEKEDFDLQVRGNQLVMSAQHQQESTQDGGRQWRQEEFYRIVPLPSGIDAEKVEAQYRNGILTITVPKTEESKGKKIEINA
jgi:HSP20 family protein